MVKPRYAITTNCYPHLLRHQSTKRARGDDTHKSCIAGMITARSHLALIEMVDECRRHGLVWRYSDTDSVCVTGEYFAGLKCY